MESKIDMNKIE
ncbi:hypothetical protein RDI58_020120 [Solanum bulbocastanum]|uniref:Uncharacterized protein n=2 Tax=Solanum TaxID=4107 RepID=A0AAN8T6M0_SOLBU